MSIQLKQMVVAKSSMCLQATIERENRMTKMGMERGK